MIFVSMETFTVIQILMMLCLFAMTALSISLDYRLRILEDQIEEMLEKTKE